MWRVAGESVVRKAVVLARIANYLLKWIIIPLVRFQPSIFDGYLVWATVRLNLEVFWEHQPLRNSVVCGHKGYWGLSVVPVEPLGPVWTSQQSVHVFMGLLTVFSVANAQGFRQWNKARWCNRTENLTLHHYAWRGSRLMLPECVKPFRFIGRYFQVVVKSQGRGGCWNNWLAKEVVTAILSWVGGGWATEWEDLIEGQEEDL